MRSAFRRPLAQLKQEGARAVAMEVSSHGLDQGRVAALEFDVAVFTNLSRDHLDYHGTMEAYGAAKARLFGVPGLSCRVINLDDGFGRALAGEERESRLISYSLEDASAYLYCPEAQLDDDGIHARLITPQGERSLRSPLLGRFNVSNVLAAVGALLGMDYPLDEILAVLPELEGPAGRMQRLGGGDRPLVVVDYAHTPTLWKRCLLHYVHTHVVACSACSAAVVTATPASAHSWPRSPSGWPMGLWLPMTTRATRRRNAFSKMSAAASSIRKR